MPSVTLTSSDVRRLETAMATLLAPLAYGDLDAWGTAVVHDLRALLGADQVMLAHALGGDLTVKGEGARVGEALDAYLAHYAQVDPGMTERRPALGLTTYHRDMLYDRATLGRTEIFQDWCVPHRLLDKVGMCAEGWAGMPDAGARALGMASDDDAEVGTRDDSVPAHIDTMPAGGLPPVVHLFRDRDGTADEAAHALALLRLLLPCFRAGTRMAEQFDRQRRQLAAAFDHATDGLLGVVRAGRIVYQNRRVGTLFAADPESAHILGTARAIAAAVLSATYGRLPDDRHTGRAFLGARVRTVTAGGGAHPDGHAALAAFDAAPAAREVATRMARYRLRATVLEAGSLAAEPAVLIAVEPCAPAFAPDGAVLRARYGLTAREAEVALLLAAGRRNTEIASALGVTEHTARRHTERVLAKLGVHSRAAAAAVLAGRA